MPLTDSRPIGHPIRDPTPKWLPQALAALGAAVVFLVLNYRAYDGYFQDDELDNLTWAPLLGARDYLHALLTPLFAKDNFRPTGHLFFTLMGHSAGLDFPAWITPLFIAHFINGLLLFFLMRKLAIRPWHAVAGASVFVLSVSAFDAYWKPMYVFDVLCTTFSLVSILLYAHGRWILSFIAFWFAYKAKELAVMLPIVLAAWEFWVGHNRFGRGRFARLIPFFAVSLSFGLQGLLLNPNKDNDYTFHFTLAALRRTVPFYSRRFLMFPFSGLIVLTLAFMRDRRVWFGLAGMAAVVSLLLFLPGRMFEAYAYLPFAFTVIALTAAASRLHPAWVWIAIAVWMPFNIHQIRREARAILAADDRIFAYVNAVDRWSSTHPGVTTLIYDNPPDPLFHRWGIEAAWTLAHRTAGMTEAVPGPARALHKDTADAKNALAANTIAYGVWNGQRLDIEVRAPTSEKATAGSAK